MTDILNTTRQIGLQAEKDACQYLEAQGLILVARNYRCALGEIDLIMQDGEYYVFVEVRTRGQDDYGSALESVNRRKQNKIIRTAIFYLQQRHLYNKVHSRFDIVGRSKKNAEFEWIKNAFSTEAF